MQLNTTNGDTMKIAQALTAYMPTAAVVAVILYATWLPAPIGDTELPLFEGIDKVIHAIFGGGLAGAILFDYTRSRPSLRVARPAVVWYVLMGVMAFMAVDESVQGMLPIGRPADYADLLADWLGAAVGALTAPRAVYATVRAARQRSR